uniref:Putative secreted protein n=1 Tax=Anopheles marajoara TaxID=58244 RepID=A0A2M4C8Q7_9DIPT
MHPVHGSSVRGLCSSAALYPAPTGSLATHWDCAKKRLIAGEGRCWCCCCRNHTEKAHSAPPTHGPANPSYARVVTTEEKGLHSIDRYSMARNERLFNEPIN